MKAFYTHGLRKGVDISIKDNFKSLTIEGDWNIDKFSNKSGVCTTQPAKQNGVWIAYKKPFEKILNLGFWGFLSAFFSEIHRKSFFF
jgi:hypothetical protein